MLLAFISFPFHGGPFNSMGEQVRSIRMKLYECLVLVHAVMDHSTEIQPNSIAKGINAFLPEQM